MRLESEKLNSIITWASHAPAHSFVCRADTDFFKAALLSHGATKIRPASSSQKIKALLIDVMGSKHGCSLL